jgi:hypothetical protein
MASLLLFNTLLHFEILLPFTKFLIQTAGIYLKIP